MTEQNMTLREIVQESRSMAESLEIDVPSDAGYVQALQPIIETLEHFAEWQCHQCDKVCCDECSTMVEQYRLCFDCIK